MREYVIFAKSCLSQFMYYCLNINKLLIGLKWLNFLRFLLFVKFNAFYAALMFRIHDKYID